MGNTVKTYKLNRDVSIECITTVNYFGEKRYSIYVLFDAVPWIDVIDKAINLTDSNEANAIFIKFRDKYKNFIITK